MYALRRRSDLVGLAVLGLCSLGVMAGPPSVAAPTQVVVDPRLAAIGTTVEVSGQGCAGPVDVEVVGLRLGTRVAVPVTTAVPDEEGAWSTSFTMPDFAVYVAATCDGVQVPLPVVAAPLGGNWMSPDSMDDERAFLTESGLVEGSQLEVRTPDGELLTSATVVDGSASVSVPRSLGPTFLSLLMLRLPYDGAGVPWWPYYSQLRLPQATTPSAVVNHRVAPTGTPLTASGRCGGVAVVQVEGQPGGFHDAPPLYVSRTVPVTAGAWSLGFPMPPEPSLLHLTCSVGTVVERAAVVLAPSDGPTVPTAVTPTPDGSGWLVEAPQCDFLFWDVTAQAFTPTGAPVELVPEPDSVFRISGDPGPVFILGLEQFPGEDAGAEWSGEPQACFAALPGGAVAPPSSAPAPAPARDVHAAAELPATGGVPLLTWALALGAVGAVLLLSARGRAGR